MNSLSFHNVWKKNESTFLLKDISFSVGAFEWVLISGPNLEGKEIIKDIVCGFDFDWDGLVLFNGENIKEIKDYGKDIAFIHNHLANEQLSQSIYEYLSFPLKLKEELEDDIQNQINDLINKSLFQTQTTKLMKDISLQDKIKVAFIRAILARARLIIFDEPFYQLVNSERKLVLETLKYLQKTFTTVPVLIFSSYFSEWSTICQRAAIINQHSLLQFDKPSQLVEDPLFVFIAKFTNSAHYSFLQGIIKKSCFITEGLTVHLPPFSNIEFYDEQEVIVGMKATSFQITPIKRSTNLGVTIKIPIQVLKEQTNDFLLFSNIGGQPFVAQVEKNVKMNEGEEVMLYIPFKELLFFDKNSEKRLR